MQLSIQRMFGTRTRGVRAGGVNFIDLIEYGNNEGVLSVSSLVAVPCLRVFIHLFCFRQDPVFSSLCLLFAKVALN
jgi:hypothetical protein